MNGDKRRRWSNELLNSLMEFQSKEELQQMSIDSMDAALGNLKIQESPRVCNNPGTPTSTKKLADITIELDSTVLMTDSGNESEKSMSDLINFSSMGSNNLNKSIREEAGDFSNDSYSENKIFDECSTYYHKTNKLTENIINLSDNETMKASCTLSSQNCTDIQSIKSLPSYYSTAKSSSQTSFQSNPNDKLIENSQVSTDSEPNKFYSCASSSQSSTDEQYPQIYTDCNTSEEPALINFQSDSNNKVLEIIQVSSGSKAVNSSCASSPQNITEKETNFQSRPLSAESSKHQVHTFFSSPTELLNNELEMINDMDEPDIWNALLELEQAFSPDNESNKKDSCIQEPSSSLLTRLSQKFKETPTRFTEKLVSIIEDSIISVESPTKQTAADTSGISLHRMTGEFRKLCKFIGDESMPDLAPSLMNTFLEKVDTPDDHFEKNKGLKISGTPKNIHKTVNNTPPHKFTPKALRNLVTPKNKITSNSGTPINKFTPSADKSFEYWESVCNIICQNKDSPKKQPRRISLTESSKRSMNEMLTICERQLASLDDSLIDIRCSEPCKKTDSDIKLKINQVPRSKSVSKLYTRDEKKTSPECGTINEKVNKQLNLDISEPFIDKHNVLIKKEINFDDSKDLIFNQSESLDDSDLMMCSPKNTNEKSFESKNLTSINSYNSDETDCSLLMELAKRRQRCLETAKLMMEIDKDDPTITEDDNKCLETLYKLGIQDKTVADVEEDTIFLNTLSQCIDYKNYFRENSKPICSMLQNFDSPEKIKNKKTPTVISSNFSNLTKPNTTKVTKTNFNKAHTESKNFIKRTEEKKKVIKDQKTLSRSVPRLNSITRATPKVKTTSKITPQVGRTNLNLNRKNLYSEFGSKKSISSEITPPTKTPLLDRRCAQTKKIVPKSTSKILNKNISIDKKDLHPKKISLERDLETKSTLEKSLSPQIKAVSNISSKSPTEKEQKKLAPKVTTPKIQHKNSPKNHESPIFKLTPKITPNLIKKVPPKNTVTPESKLDNFPVLHEKSENILKLAQKKTKLFVSPGKSPSVCTFTRKKPVSYFSDADLKKRTPQKNLITFDSVKSPIGLYVNGTDAQFVQNVYPETNEWLLTPVGNKEDGTPKLKINLAAKENQSPRIEIEENLLLPSVNYESTPKKRVLHDKTSYSPSLLTSNSRKNLLEERENTLVVRHTGRVRDPILDSSTAETSVLVQKMAEKTATIRKKFF